MSDIDSLLQAEIRAALDPQFNGIVVEAFGCGIYTLLLFQTIWKIYLKERKLLYCLTLLIMWIMDIASFIGDWTQNTAAFVANNSSPIAIVLNVVTSTPSAYIPGIIALGISDGIIIWRCYVLWRSKIILSILVIFLCAMISLGFCANVLALTSLVGLIQALSALLSFTTTASATFLIALKIHLVTRQTHRNHRYTKIIEILVQSAAILSTVQLGLAVLSLMDFVQQFDLTTTRGNASYQLLEYLLNIQIPISGIVPTLIALRVAKEGSHAQTNSAIRPTPPSMLPLKRTTQNTESV